MPRCDPKQAMVAERASMKRWLAALGFLIACAPEPSPVSPVSAPVATAAAIPEGDTPAGRRELFQAALALHDHGELSSAEPLFAKLVVVYPELADYSLRYLARIAEARADEARALSHWQALLDRYADSVWRGEAELSLGRAAAADKNWSAASKLVEAAIRDLKDSAERAAALGSGSEVAGRLGDAEKARAFDHDLRLHYPQSPQAIAARERAWRERDVVALASAASAREEVSLLLAENEASRALELVRLAESRFPADGEMPDLLWLEASALSHLGERDAAERVLERIRSAYPRQPVAARALFRLGSLAWNRDNDERALQLFGAYARQYPTGPQAAEAIYASGRIHQEANRYSLAAREFARLARLYPKSSLAPEARFRVGWCEYRSGNQRRAADVFASIASRGGPDSASALYWNARVSGDDAAYRTLLRDHPESYYAGLAEMRLGQPPGSALSGRIVRADGSSVHPSTCDVPDPHRTRFDELEAMSLAALARNELAVYQERVSGCDGFLIRSWVTVGGYRQSIGRALHASGCGTDASWLRFCYPLGFWEIVEREAGRRAIDPLLVAALIRQESLFDSEARSSANAIGLMQILPVTGERLAVESGSPVFSAEQLYNPARNISLGTAYLQTLGERYGGNQPRILAAYNAGEAAVDKWQRRYPGVDDDEFVESISYRETRGYVKRVLQNRRLYGALYGDSPTANPAASG
jgi:peptidoglycan lytic transglycosylase